MKLTVKKIEQLKKKPGRYGDGHGLYLQVLSKTNQSWLLRYERGGGKERGDDGKKRRRGRERWLGLGPLHTFGLQRRENGHARLASTLAGLGWTDDRNVRMDLRYAGADPNRFRARPEAASIRFAVAQV
jgi:hypothetical protein